MNSGERLMMKTTLCLGLTVASIALAETPVAETNAPAAAPKTISIQEMLVTGSSGMRLHSLAMITQGKVKDGVDESFLPGFTACASDPAVPIRSVAARIMGQQMVAGQDDPNPEAVALLIKLAQDESADVQFSAVYHGLAQLNNKSDEVVALLLDVATTNREQSLYDRIAESLKDSQEQVILVLDKKLETENSVAIYEIYEDMSGKKPASMEKFLNMPCSRPKMFIFKGDGGDPEAFKAELATELKSTGLENPDLFVSGTDSSYVILLQTALTKDRILVEKSFSEHERFKITQELWLTPALEVQMDSMRKAP
jgi:hypothetical protein